jgi:uncharacterized membrane protein YdjX (TVP38/TMEM64 family)
MLLALTFIAAYVLFSAKDFSLFHQTISNLGYAGSFLCGMAYAYGFTGGPSTALLLILSKEQDIIIAALVGGVGAVISDVMIFKFVRHSLADEVEKLTRATIVKKINAGIPRLLKKYLFPVLAVFVIASPLPDEIGVSMYAACTKIRLSRFFIVSYALNTLGILSILALGNLI